MLNFDHTVVLANGGGAGVIKVSYKFAGSERTLSALRAHDDVRHLNILAGVDLPLGGTGRPDAVGWVFLPFIFLFYSICIYFVCIMNLNIWARQKFVRVNDW